MSAFRTSEEKAMAVSALKFGRMNRLGRSSE